MDRSSSSSEALNTQEKSFQLLSEHSQKEKAKNILPYEQIKKKFSKEKSNIHLAIHCVQVQWCADIYWLALMARPKKATLTKQMQ